MNFVFNFIKIIILLLYISDIFLKANITKIFKKIRYFTFVKSRLIKTGKKINIKNQQNMENMNIQKNSFIDIGSNLTDKMFDGIYNTKKHENDLKYVLNRARSHNVEKIIITCTCLKDIDKSLKICETHDPKGNFLFLTAGVHPTSSYEFVNKHDMETKNELARNEFEEFRKYFKNRKNILDVNPKHSDLKEIEEHSTSITSVKEGVNEKKTGQAIIKESFKIPGFVYNEKDHAYLEKLKEKIENHSDKIISIGEIGLDFDRLYFCPKYLQIKYFIYQLKLVEIYRLPIFLHMRNCSDIFFEILDIYKPLIEDVGAVIHSFTDKEDVIKKIKNYKNLYIGVNGCSLKNIENINAVKRIPLNLLLLETDSPWCSIRRTHASYPYIKEKFEKRNYVNLKKVPNLIKCDDSTIFKERNEPYNIVDIAEATYKIQGLDISFNSFCTKVRHNTLNLFKKMK
ncbi:TatD-like deoxyribonuclease, putative [Hepatocystis sp. ex Piliocolobus tephrosceles]|nr:TatD-like deoxyribonuclease, putative [Hepatocystis sp. ex Piliocolobus tephrosceles]